MNRTLLFGEGLFETILWRGETKKLRLHYERMRSSAKALELPHPSYEEFLKAIKTKAQKDSGIYVKVLLLFSGPNSFGEKPENYELKVITGEPPEVPESVKITVSPYRRHSKDPLCRHKTTSYLFNVLVRREARKRGFYDALILNEREEITECSASNILLLKGERLITPARDSGLLWGTTIEVLRREAGVEEEYIKISEVLSADSLFLVNSLIGVVPVSALGEERLPVDREVLRYLRSVVEGFNSPRGT